MDKERIRKILHNYNAGLSSDEERAWIETWYNEYKGTANHLSDDDIKRDLQEVYESLPNTRSIKVIPLWLRIAATVAILVTISVLLHSYLKEPTEQQSKVQSKINNETDISPGGYKAILTLADGSTISLDDASTGEIAAQQGLKISKTDDGQITYTAIPSLEGRKPSSLITYNKISTPRGGQYEIILPDGTKVWLNAASTLKYPTTFTENERVVELIGEAYFEVAQIKERISHDNIKPYVPFLVNTPNQLVKVLGTHFNINAYEDEPSTKTTLLEGSVKVIPNASSLDNNPGILLRPGEQSTLVRNDDISVSKVNTANVIAWKSGLFQFQNSDIESVMREFSRWYDVEVEFEGTMPDIKLWGEVYRNVDASQALEILGYFNLKYKIEQTDGVKKIIIS